MTIRSLRAGLAAFLRVDMRPEEGQAPPGANPRSATSIQGFCPNASMSRLISLSSASLRRLVSLFRLSLAHHRAGNRNPPPAHRYLGTQHPTTFRQMSPVQRHNEFPASRSQPLGQADGGLLGADPLIARKAPGSFDVVVNAHLEVRATRHLGQTYLAALHQPDRQIPKALTLALEKGPEKPCNDSTYATPFVRLSASFRQKRVALLYQKASLIL